MFDARLRSGSLRAGLSAGWLGRDPTSNRGESGRARAALRAASRVPVGRRCIHHSFLSLLRKWDAVRVWVSRNLVSLYLPIRPSVRVNRNFLPCRVKERARRPHEHTRRDTEPHARSRRARRPAPPPAPPGARAAAAPRVSRVVRAPGRCDFVKALLYDAYRTTTRTHRGLYSIIYRRAAPFRVPFARAIRERKKSHHEDD